MSNITEVAQQWPSDDAARFSRLRCVEGNLRSRLNAVGGSSGRMSYHDSTPMLCAGFNELSILIREIHVDRVSLSSRYGFGADSLLYLFE